MRKWMAWSAGLLASMGAVAGWWHQRGINRHLSADNVTEPGLSSEENPQSPLTTAPMAAHFDLLPKWMQWLVISVIGLSCLLLAFVFPAPYSTLLLGVLVLGSVAGAVVIQRRRVRESQAMGIAIERSTTLRSLALLAEAGCIVGVVLAVNWTFVRSDNFERVYGYELEWLTSSAHFAHLSLRDYGYLPLWQPYNGFGEPLIDNPFSFVLNPLSSGPTLLFGGVQGIKISIVLYGLFAGFGGYFLARVLRLGLAGRLLLALLMIGKGNMLAMIGTGYYQLGVAQAYFPWIIGAALAVLRLKQARWAVVLLAVMFTLLFWAGNIWYVLPMLFSLTLLTLFHVLPWNGRTFDGAALRRILLAAVLTLGLCAVTLLPIFANRANIGQHPREVVAGAVTDPVLVAQQFVTGDRTLFGLKIAPYQPQFYYSFVSPVWFLALIFLLLPPIGVFRVFNRNALSQPWRFWVPGTIVLVGSFIWGVGGNPLMIWLYDTIPLLSQWRFVGRALAVTSFWIAVLIALRVDSLWRLIFSPGFALPALPERAVRAARLNLGTLVLVLSGIAAVQVNQAASFYARTTPREVHDTTCIAWLREQFPDRPLALWRSGYDLTMPFLDYEVSQIGIEADYTALPVTSTIGEINLLRSRAPYAFGWDDEDYLWLARDGYEAVVDSPRSQGVSCLYRYPRALSYAYMVSLSDMEAAYGEALDPQLTIPITTFERHPDRIRLRVSGNSERAMVVTIQESAYPGWQASVNGQTATLQSVGGQVGILIPASTDSYDILFEYRPPLFFAGGALTLVTWAVSIGYLLRAERLLQNLWRKRREKRRTSPGS